MMKGKIMAVSHNWTSQFSVHLKNSVSTHNMKLESDVSVVKSGGKQLYTQEWQQ